MYRYSAANNKTLAKAAASSLAMASAANLSHEPLFDPLHYEFDAETMVEPFTYFHNGPTESRRKASEFSSPTLSHLAWLPAHHSSPISSPDESPQSYYSPTVNERLVPLKTAPVLPHQPSYVSYPKTVCRHCKSHNMPECLYTSHSMYDENGAIFCPVLKKCHCATCVRVTNPNNIGDDDDSDDDSNIRLPAMSAEASHFDGAYARPSSYRLSTNNNF